MEKIQQKEQLINISKKVFRRLLLIFIVFFALNYISTSLSQAESVSAKTKIDKQQQQQLLQQQLIQKIQALSDQTRELNKKHKDTLSSSSLDELKNVSQERLDAMEELIQTDPQAAIRLAMPEAERAQFPKEVQAELEEYVTLEGPIEVMIADNFAEGTSTTHTSLVTKQGRYDLHFTDPSIQLISGTKVRIKGVRARKHIAVSTEKGRK